MVSTNTTNKLQQEQDQEEQEQGQEEGFSDLKQLAFMLRFQQSQLLLDIHHRVAANSDPLQ